MADHEWYRSNTWSPEVAEAFEVRLRRARTWSRPQYLRIQGATLAESPEVGDREVGRELYRRVLREFPEDEACKYTAECLGESLLHEGRPLEALEWLLDAMRRIEASPSGDSMTSGTVPMLVAKAMLAARDDDAVDHDVADWLARAAPNDDEPFASIRFDFFLVSARAARRRGDARAAHFARQALAVLDEPDPFRRHPGVGVPRPTSHDIDWLAQVASSRPTGDVDGPRQHRDTR